MNYEQATKFAYDAAKAQRYKAEQTSGMKWMRFTTWREKSFVGRCLQYCNLKRGVKILDIPCGTGVLGQILWKFPSSIVASDISSEMMRLARGDYNDKCFLGFVQADITSAPFKEGAFDCVVTLGLMHRLPAHVRDQALREIMRLSGRFIIVSYSVKNRWDHIKHWLLKQIWHSYKSAPSSISKEELVREVELNNLSFRKSYRVMPFLSAENVFLIEKRSTEGKRVNI